MNKKTVIGLMLLAAFARESVAQSTPTASQLDQERQRIELERKQMFDPNNPASKAKKRYAQLGRHRPGNAPRRS